MKTTLARSLLLLTMVLTGVSFATALAAQVTESSAGSWKLYQNSGSELPFSCVATIEGRRAALVFSGSKVGVEMGVPPFVEIAVGSDVWKFRKRKGTATFEMDGGGRVKLNPVFYQDDHLNHVMTMPQLERFAEYGRNPKTLKVIDHKERALVQFPVNGFGRAMDFLIRCMK